MTHPPTVEIASQALAAHVAELSDAHLSLGAARRLLEPTEYLAPGDRSAMLVAHIVAAQQTVAAAVLALGQLARELGAAAAAIEALADIAAVSAVELDDGTVNAADLVRRAVEGCGYLGASS
jgi:hypothetical protein